MTKAMADWMWSTKDTDIQSNQCHFLLRLKTLPFQVQVNERTSTLEGLESTYTDLQRKKPGAWDGWGPFTEFLLVGCGEARGQGS